MSINSKKRDIKSFFSTHYGSGSGSDSDQSPDHEAGTREGDGDGRSEAPDVKEADGGGDSCPRRPRLDSEDYETVVPSMTPKDFHRTLKHLPPDQIHIPAASTGPVDPLVQEKLERLAYTKETQALDMKHEIQKRKDFRNPSIYEKLIDHCAIREFGSNFPTDVFDPDAFDATSYYEELSKAQKVLMDSIADKEKESHPKVEIIHATAKKITSSSSSSVTSDQMRKPDHKRVSGPSSEPKKRSKWDDGPKRLP